MAPRFHVVFFVGLATVIGCEQKTADRTPHKVTSDDVRRDADSAAHTAVEYSQQTKEEFQKSLDARLREMDSQIESLREKGRGLKDEAKSHWDQRIAELETKRAAARAKLAEVGHSSAEAWKDVRQGAQSAWDDLYKAVHDASRQF